MGTAAVAGRTWAHPSTSSSPDTMPVAPTGTSGPNTQPVRAEDTRRSAPSTADASPSASASRATGSSASMSTATSSGERRSVCTRRSSSITGSGSGSGGGDRGRGQAQAAIGERRGALSGTEAAGELGGRSGAAAGVGVDEAGQVRVVTEQGSHLDQVGGVAGHGHVAGGGEQDGEPEAVEVRCGRGAGTPPHLGRRVRGRQAPGRATAGSEPRRAEVA